MGKYKQWYGRAKGQISSLKSAIKGTLDVEVTDEEMIAAVDLAVAEKKAAMIRNFLTSENDIGKIIAIKEVLTGEADSEPEPSIEEVKSAPVAKTTAKGRGRPRKVKVSSSTQV